MVPEVSVQVQSEAALRLALLYDSNRALTWIRKRHRVETHTESVICGGRSNYPGEDGDHHRHSDGKRQGVI